MTNDTYAIIQLNGKQFQVSVGDILRVDRLATDDKDSFTISDVLLTSNKGKVTVGKPTVTKASVTCKVIEADAHTKTRVSKYKSKSRYRRTIGHKQPQTVFEVTKIVA